nr:cob(I)yrinic acid a,c-diamide adenosyltransferase [Candidatus Levybacteria bacterium]
MPIYTKFGDKGKTSLYGGKTVSKADIRVNAYGQIDELNSFLGIIIAEIKNKIIKKQLIVIQNDLFEIGSSLASPATNKHKNLSKYLTARVLEFEKTIDKLSKKLLELENFILPGGSKTGSKLHYARTLARKAERQIVALSEKEKINLDILIFINRLSDLLFTYARFVSKQEKKKEVVWRSRE